MNTCKQIINVTELKELYEVSSRIKNRLEALRSYWDDSLVTIIFDHLKCVLDDDADYQKIFVDDSLVPIIFDHLKSFHDNCVDYKEFFVDDLVSDDVLRSYNMKYSIFKNAVVFLEEKGCLVELTEILDFLKSLGTWDGIPLTDDALRDKLLWKKLSG